jgi:GNAT superfamily N-acetyltransferase
MDGAGTGRYPVELESRWTTRLGTTVQVRPIKADDAARLLVFHRRLAPGSVYRRHFFVHPELSPAEGEHFACVDYLDRLALIVEDHGELIAVGRYDRIPGTPEAEVAFVVADAHQHLGIGSMLLDRLAAAARPIGIATFIASTLADNRTMVDVFLHSGFPTTMDSSHGVVAVRMAIAPDSLPVSGEQGPMALPDSRPRGDAEITLTD